MAWTADPISTLAAALDIVVSTDPMLLGDSESIVALHRQIDRLEAVATRAAAAFDAHGSWSADGARSASAWLATRCRLPLGSSRRRVRIGRELRHMAHVEEAWLDGDIGVSQVSLMVRARATDEACFERDEAMLVGHAQELQYRHFARTLAYWCQLADPDGAEASAEALHESRHLHLSRSFEGCRIIDGVFDPVGGAIFATALDRIEKELFDQDWAEARARVGERVRVTDLSRTPAQRRADAAVEMARRAGAAPAGARKPEPLFTVFVGYETFAGRICELAGGAVVSPGSLIPWLDQAWVERAVFDGPNRLKNVGVHRRLFAGGTRRAVELRERECFSEFCDVPAADCQIDHVEPWAEGGLTIAENGRPACGWHNRWRQRQGSPPGGEAASEKHGHAPTPSADPPGVSTRSPATR